MNNNKRIALIGPPESRKTIVSLILSELLKMERTGGKPIDLVYSNIFKKKASFYSVNELYTVGLAQFHYRVKDERNGRFVSDGSVLNEPALIRASISVYNHNLHVKQSLKTFLLKNKYEEFQKKIEQIIKDYAKTAYDKIYFLNGIGNYSEYNEEVKNILLDWTDKIGIGYKIPTGSVESLIEQILVDLDCKMNDKFMVTLIIDKYYKQ